MDHSFYLNWPQLPEVQGPFRPNSNIVLASASPRRQALLASLGLFFDVLPARFKEPLPETGQLPADYALFLARKKAGEVAKGFPSSLVLGADTIVVMEDNIMGKPGNQDHALEMLRQLQGNTHQVITAVSMISLDRKINESFAVKTLVEMVPAPDDLLMEYIRTGEPEDKAGAYAIQGVGGFLVKSISGSYTNVVGLPLAEVWTALFRLGGIKLPGDHQ